MTAKAIQTKASPPKRAVAVTTETVALDDIQPSNHRDLCGPSPPHKVVIQTYRDHARDSPLDNRPSIRTGLASDDESKQTNKVARGGVAVTFPEHLYNMLCVASKQCFDNVISWQPHGRCFLIHNQLAFATKIMPRFFAHTKYKSFQRQLNIYGFARIKTSFDRGSYFHPDLVQSIVRNSIKGNGMKGTTSSDTEPNFYTMPYCYQHHQDGDHIKDNKESEQQHDNRDADQISASVPLCRINNNDDMSMVPEPVGGGLVSIVTQSTSFGYPSYRKVVPARCCNDWPEHLFMPLADNRPSNSSFSFESVYLSPMIQQQQHDLISRKIEEQESLSQATQQRQAKVQQCDVDIDGEYHNCVHDDANEFDDTPISLHQGDEIEFLEKTFCFVDLPESLLLQDDLYSK